jgi:Zn-dependent protease with chaperone function
VKVTGQAKPRADSWKTTVMMGGVLLLIGVLGYLSVGQYGNPGLVLGLCWILGIVLILYGFYLFGKRAAEKEVS